MVSISASSTLLTVLLELLMPATENQRVVVVTGAARGLGVRSSILSTFISSLIPSLQFEWVRQYRDSQNTFVIAIVRSAKTANKLLEIVDDNVAIVEVDLGRIDTFGVSIATYEPLHMIINMISAGSCKVN